MSKFKVEVVSRRAPRPRKDKRPHRKRAAALEGRATGARLYRLLRWLGRQRVATWLLAASVAGVFVYGTPHVLVTYQCTGAGTPGVRCFECRYFGVQGMRSYLGPQWNCPFVTVLPVDWAPVIGKVTGNQNS